MIRSAPIAILLLGAVGCSEDPGAEAELLVPDDLGLHWDRSFNGENDGRVALVPVDLMVYEAESGEQVVGVDLVVQPTYDAATVLPQGDILPLDAEDCGRAPCVWDAWRDRYVELADSPWGEVEPQVMSTDENGLVRAYLLVDAFPEGAGGFEPVPVVVSMGRTDASFQLVPQ